MPDTSRTLVGPVPSIIVAPDGTVHVRIHATTLHLAAGEFMELVTRSLDALAVLTRLVRRERGDGELQ